MTEARRFILQALDPDHGSPVFEALFWVDRLEDLRPLVSERADEDSELAWGYTLRPDELAAITARFGVAFDPQGRETCLCAWDGWCEMPYLSHNGYELPLLLEGRKPFACMSGVYPPHQHPGEERFDRYVAQGLIHKNAVVRRFRAHGGHAVRIRGLAVRLVDRPSPRAPRGMPRAIRRWSGDGRTDRVS